MCMIYRQPELADELTACWYAHGHADAALREGWLLGQTCRDSTRGPLQVHCADDTSAPRATLKRFCPVAPLASDGDAWRLVRDGLQPHHFAARDLLARFNPVELGAITLCCPAPVADS
jgi:hypothetical protein